MNLIKVLLLTLVLTVSCNHHPSFLVKEVKKVQSNIQRYKIDQYDCSNLDFELCQALHDKGHDARIVTYQASMYHHAIVEVYYNSRYYYLDPTNSKMFVERPKVILTTWKTSQLYQLKTNSKYRDYILGEFK